jgi:hypothetical protein
MAATPKPEPFRYRKTSPPGAGQYEVLLKDVVIGRVGQFGSRWMATTPRRRKSGQYLTREAAAAWLIDQAGFGHRS